MRNGFLIKLTPGERATFKREAKLHDLSLAAWMRRAATDAADLGGIVVEGPGERAVLTIGLRADKPRPTSIVRRKGAHISTQAARNELRRLREKQVGKLGAAATVVKCEGIWGGRKAETALTCEIEYVPSPKETARPAFRRNMLSLAESAAERLGQEEIWLRMGGKLYRANAPKEKAPKILRRGGRVIR